MKKGSGDTKRSGMLQKGQCYRKDGKGTNSEMADVFEKSYHHN